jgi:CRISPR/Cas system CSM-associated protein Csm4 (group 5 of RAMP superfamily)
MKQSTTINDIKRLYPDEWVLLGNPVIDRENQQIVSGVLLYHSPDKKEVCYLGKPLMNSYEKTALLFTKTFKQKHRTIGLLTRINP